MKYTSILLIIIVGYMAGCVGSRVSVVPIKQPQIIANWQLFKASVDSFYSAADQSYNQPQYSAFEASVAFMTAQDSTRLAHGLTVRQDLIVYKTLTTIDAEHSAIGKLNAGQAGLYKREMDIIIKTRLDAESNLPTK